MADKEGYSGAEYHKQKIENLRGQQNKRRSSFRHSN